MQKNRPFPKYASMPANSGFKPRRWWTNFIYLLSFCPPGPRLKTFVHSHWSEFGKGLYMPNDLIKVVINDFVYIYVPGPSS